MRHWWCQNGWCQVPGEFSWFWNLMWLNVSAQHGCRCWEGGWQKTSEWRIWLVNFLTFFYSGGWNLPGVQLSDAIEVRTGHIWRKQDIPDEEQTERIHRSWPRIKDSIRLVVIFSFLKSQHLVQTQHHVVHHPHPDQFVHPSRELILDRSLDTTWSWEEEVDGCGSGGEVITPGWGHKQELPDVESFT